MTISIIQHVEVCDRSEGFRPNGIFGSWAWWSGGLTKWGELLGLRRRRQRRRLLPNACERACSAHACERARQAVVGAAALRVEASSECTLLLLRTHLRRLA